VKLPSESCQVVHGNVELHFDRRIQQLLRKQDSLVAGPILRPVVGRKHAPCPPALRVEAPIAIPATEVEHALAGEIDRIELFLDEFPDGAVIGGIGGLALRAQPIAEIELVIPENFIDPSLDLGTIHLADPELGSVRGRLEPRLYHERNSRVY